MTQAPRSIRRPAAVIFDMDGLMLDTEPLAARAWSDAASAMSVEFDSALALSLIGRNFTDCARIVRAHYGPEYPVDGVLDGWHAAHDAIVEREGLALKPGVHELLDWLDLNAIPRAVATSTRRERARIKLHATALLARFDELVGGDEIANGKPAPDIHLEAAQRLRVPAADCVVLEDSEPGVRAAIAAGATPIMVPDLLPPSAELLALELIVMPTLHEVRCYLARLPS